MTSQMGPYGMYTCITRLQQIPTDTLSDYMHKRQVSGLFIASDNKLASYENKKPSLW